MIKENVLKGGTKRVLLAFFKLILGFSNILCETYINVRRSKTVDSAIQNGRFCILGITHH